MSKIEWRTSEEGMKPWMVLESGMSRPVDWCPLPGSQTAFLSSPVFETVYEGTRGPGKTDALLMDFAQHTGQGYGREWRGVLFRQTYEQLQDVINKAIKLYTPIFRGAKYNAGEHFWTWPDGEMLLLRYFAKPKDYWNYHGHAYPWIGWEELTSWSTDECYTSMMACSRSTLPNMPRKYRATTNPYGVGHNWVKQRFRLPQGRGKVIRDSTKNGKPEPYRVAIHGHIDENFVLLYAEPDYKDKIRAAASNPAMAEAWLDGSWDITSGGMFDDLWRGEIHIVDPLPIEAIREAGWKIDRSFDWGSSKPFSVGWWAESNGEPIVHKGKTYGAVRGDLYRIAEWYGWAGQRNVGVKMSAREIALGIKDREEDLGLRNGRYSYVQSGPADASIFDDENNVNLARDMEREGIRWEAADKAKGSRKQGWQKIRERLSNALPRPNEPREHPGLFVFSTCQQFIITFPSLPRSDKDPDDIDSNAEDHIADETRYRVREKIRQVSRRGWK